MKLEVLLVAVLTFTAFSARANEGGGGGGEAKKEAEKSAAPEWIEIQARLAASKGKIAAKEKVVRDLIEEKQKVKDPRQSREIVENLKREHKELRQASEEYARDLGLLRYRYPEKGLKEEQQYRRREVKSLTEMEKEVSLEGRLQNVSVKVRRQYGEPETAETPAAERTEKPAAPQAPSITKPPVLTK